MAVAKVGRERREVEGAVAEVEVEERRREEERVHWRWLRLQFIG